MAFGLARRIWRRLFRGSVEEVPPQALPPVSSATNWISKAMNSFQSSIRKFSKDLQNVETRLAFLAKNSGPVELVELAAATDNVLKRAKTIEERAKTFLKVNEQMGTEMQKLEAQNLILEATKLRHYAEETQKAAQRAIDNQGCSTAEMTAAYDSALTDIKRYTNLSKEASKTFQRATNHRVWMGSASVAFTYPEDNRTETTKAVQNGLLTALDYNLKAGEAVECAVTVGLMCAVDAGLGYAFNKAVDVSAPVVEKAIDLATPVVQTAGSTVNTVADEAGKQFNEKVGTKLEAAFRVPEKATQEIGNRATGGSWWPSFSP
ncbi:MAG: hypothetical protein K1X66_03480 [Verrucomicrobiae bacterium]|nr:hypothetical protein [Verrucomicrobiae bacterium]